MAELGLETKGTKAELLARVEKYLKEQGRVSSSSFHVWQHATCIILCDTHRRRFIGGGGGGGGGRG